MVWGAPFFIELPVAYAWHLTLLLTDIALQNQDDVLKSVVVV